jgi:hypothetical protein
MASGPFDVALVGMLTGIVAIVGSLVVIVIVATIAMRNRRLRAEMLHKERLMAIEKGLPLPPDYSEQPKKKRPYMAGLVWAAIGAGALLWGVIERATSESNDYNAWGIVPLLVGIALLIGDRISISREAAMRSEPSPYPLDPGAQKAPDNRS